MMPVKIDELISSHIAKLLKKNMKPGRLKHSYSVARFAIFLCEKFGYSTKKSVIAAMLHDCSKDLPYSKNKKLITRCTADKIIIRTPVLWHSYTGKHIAKNTYGITDMEVLNAVKFHTIGSPGMGIIAKIVYVSDFADPGREYKESMRIGKMCYQKGIGLDKLVFEVVKSKVNYLKSHNMKIHPSAIRLYNKLKK